jgi:Calx-beta domain-containing protein
MTQPNSISVNAASSAERQQRVDVVHYAMANGTAQARSDFTTAFGAMIIPAGQTSRMLTVAVTGDRIPAPTETFAVIADAQGICTIVEDDELPRISINDVSKSEGKTLTRRSASLSAARPRTTRPSRVNYANGTATSGSDYLAKSGSVRSSPAKPSRRSPCRSRAAETVDRKTSTE